MNKGFVFRCSKALLIPAAFFLMATTVEVVGAQPSTSRPTPINVGTEVSASLTEQDILIDQQGLAKDYVVNLTRGDQIAIDLTSESFDTMALLLASDETVLAINDDEITGGTTNSLLFARIKETGSYIVRVTAFDPQSSGPFKLKISRLRTVE